MWELLRAWALTPLVAQALVVFRRRVLRVGFELLVGVAGVLRNQYCDGVIHYVWHVCNAIPSNKQPRLTQPWRRHINKPPRGFRKPRISLVIFYSLLHRNPSCIVLEAEQCWCLAILNAPTCIYICECVCGCASNVMYCVIYIVYYMYI